MSISICLGGRAKYGVQADVLKRSIHKRTVKEADILDIPVHDQYYHTSVQEDVAVLSKFLTPYAWAQEKLSIYMDARLYCLCDVREIIEQFNPQYVMQLVHHPSLGKLTSLILFNNTLASHYYSPQELLEMSRQNFDAETLRNIPQDLIGELPLAFNHIVTPDQAFVEAKVINFKHGAPHEVDYGDNLYAKQWLTDYQGL